MIAGETAARAELPRALFEACVRYRIAQALGRVRRAHAAFMRLRRKSARFDAAKRTMWAAIDDANAELSELERLLPEDLKRTEPRGFDGWRGELVEKYFETALEHRLRVDPEG